MSDPWGSLEGLTAVQRARLDEIQARPAEERDGHLRQSDGGKERAAQEPWRTDLDLTGQELAVLRLIADGRTNPEIAADLFIGVETAKSHVKGMMRKLEASSRAHAVAVGFRLGLIE